MAAQFYMQTKEQNEELNGLWDCNDPNDVPDDDTDDSDAESDSEFAAYSGDIDLNDGLLRCKDGRCAYRKKARTTMNTKMGARASYKGTVITSLMFVRRCAVCSRSSSSAALIASSRWRISRSSRGEQRIRRSHRPLRS
jgi:hypothetical protein